jgi:hypothetical protein
MHNEKLGLLVYNEDSSVTSVHGHVFLKKVRTCGACAMRRIREFRTCDACAMRKYCLLVYNEDRSVHGHVFLKKVRNM